eukprot:c24527_g1_i2 orf=196-786(-)
MLDCSSAAAHLVLHVGDPFWQRSALIPTVPASDHSSSPYSFGGMDYMPWAAQPSHLGGIPRRVVFTTVGALSKLWISFLNSTQVHNQQTLFNLVKSRPRGTPLLTISNHMSTLDDPLMWGLRGLPADPKLGRWCLAANDICFTNALFSYFFRLGKCIPITRGAGIYQPHMNEALDRLKEGEWVHEKLKLRINCCGG